MRGLAVRVAGAVVLVAAVVGLVIGAGWGTRVVAHDRSPARAAQARLDDAYYRCLEIQARSLVGPGQTVAVAADGLGSYVTLFKAVASWAPLAAPGAADVSLSLRRTSRGPACLGDVVVAKERRGGRTVVRRGTGADLPGSGPPPVLPY